MWKILFIWFPHFHHEVGAFVHIFHNIWKFLSTFLKWYNNYIDPATAIWIKVVGMLPTPPPYSTQPELSQAKILSTSFIKYWKILLTHQITNINISTRKLGARHLFFFWGDWEQQIKNWQVNHIVPVALFEHFRALKQTPLEHFRALKLESPMEPLGP